jgi:hypothetical protein
MSATGDLLLQLFLTGVLEEFTSTKSAVAVISHPVDHTPVLLA